MLSKCHAYCIHWFHSGVCVCVHVCEHLYACVSACICGGQRLTLAVFFSHSPPYILSFWDKFCSPIWVDWLASKSPEILLSSPHRCWEYRHMSGSLNPGSHACAKSTLPIQGSHPQILYFFMENSKRAHPRLRLQIKEGHLSSVGSASSAPFHPWAVEFCIFLVPKLVVVSQRASSPRATPTSPHPQSQVSPFSLTCSSNITHTDPRI